MNEHPLTAMGRGEDLPPELEQQIAALAAEEDETLWAMLRGRFSPAKSARLEELHFQYQAGDWDENDGNRIQETEQLANEMEAYMLLRAQAMSLLMQRGHDPAKILEQLQIVQVSE